MEIKCKYCLKFFYRKNSRKKFCSDKCKSAYHYYGKKDISFITNFRKVCKFCEKTFKPIKVDSNFCSDKCRQYWFYFKDNKRNAAPTFQHREALKLGNKLRTNNRLSKTQIQVCLGSMMGDGCIALRKSNNSRLMIGHSIKQLDYLLWKKKLLSPFVLSNNLNISESHGFSKGTYACGFSSIMHQDFTDIGTLFYRKISGKRTKVITRKILNMIGPLGILIWYLDDGSFSSDKAIKLATHGFTLSENKAIKIWFWQKYRIKATIHEENYHEKKYFFITLNVSGSRILLNMISKYIKDIPDCMMYKIVK